MLTPFLPQNFNIAGYTFSSYGLFLGIGVYIVLSTIYNKYKSKLHVIDYLILALTTFAGARGLYLLHNIFRIIDGQFSIFDFSQGGLALYGAITGLLIAAIGIAAWRKIPLLKFTDSLFLNFPLAQTIGRFGNFFNYELYGSPSNLPWAVKIPQENRLPGYENFTTFHPAFLYESILNLFNWLILKYISGKKIKDGTITLVFLFNYGIIRLLLNLIRIDKEFLFGLETSDIFSVLFVFLSAFTLFIIYANNRHEKKLATAVSYGLSAYMTAVLPIILASYITRAVIAPWIPILLIILLPTALLFVFFKLRLINDFDISDRSKRPLFMTFLSILYLLFYLWVSTTGALILIKISLALVILSVFFTIISTFWKISGHMTYLLFAITSINFIFLNPFLIYLYLLVPLVAWARVKLNQHTPMQTVIGTATAMLICLGLFYLI